MMRHAFALLLVLLSLWMVAAQGRWRGEVEPAATESTAAVLASSNPPGPAAAPIAPRPLSPRPRFRWSVLYYIAYNNDLDVYLEPDLRKLVAAGSTGDDTVFHFLISTRAHPRPWHVRVQGEISDQFWKPRQEAEAKADTDAWMQGWRGLYDADDTPAHTLLRFLRDSIDEDPADRFAFFFNGDGGCVYLSIQPPAAINGSYARDGSVPASLSHSFIGISELARVFEAASLHLSIFAFDCCMMATLEAAYEMRLVADLMLFSEQYEGGVGLNSKALVEAFREDKLSSSEPDLASVHIAQWIARDYIRRVNNASDLEPGDTLADKRDITLVRSSRVEALVQAIEALQRASVWLPPLSANHPSNAYVDPLPEDEGAFVDLYTTVQQQCYRQAQPDSAGQRMADTRQRKILRLQSDDAPAASSSSSTACDRAAWHRFDRAFTAAVLLYEQNDGLRAIHADSPPQVSAQDGRSYISDSRRFHGLSVCVDAHRDSSPGAQLFDTITMPKLFAQW